MLITVVYGLIAHPYLSKSSITNLNYPRGYPTLVSSFY
jgi:hypothetical protein